MLLYAITTFVSAFLLFQVQPMITKIILPWFGGSAAVWITALMFFQVSLLLGYLYAWASNRFLTPAQQPVLHLILLAASLLLLPVIPSSSWKQISNADPMFRILGVLGATVGMPYLLLATTGPLMQAWYTRTHTGAIPYRLYALSNFGSMLALLSYPVIVEPFFSGTRQAWLWSSLYAFFVLVCSSVAWRSRRITRSLPVSTTTIRLEGPRPNWKAALLWMSLAACASLLLLAVTNYLTQNIAPIPFLWVLPLSIYLLSFILCFEKERTYRREVFLLLLLIALAGFAIVFTQYGGSANIRWAIPAFGVGFFVVCMFCHGEVARRKPHPEFLTLFYLMISIGGALGGLFVGLIAPRIFNTYYEFPIGLVLCGVLAVIAFWTEPAQFGKPSLLVAGLALFTLAIAVYMGRAELIGARKDLLRVRNFYGALRVYDQPENHEQSAMRVLVHGTIDHGQQLLDTDYRRLPTAYYGEHSGVGMALKRAQQNPSMRVGVIGLGAGVTAAYCRAGDVFRFYDINPLVPPIAENRFTFLNDCLGDKKVLLGDARLILEEQPPQQFDVLAVDAFSGDAIPVHLLTKEAVELYFRHLKPTGVLAIHISNKYLNLEPVVAAIAQDIGQFAMTVDDSSPADADYLSGSTWVVFPREGELWPSPAKEVTIKPLGLKRPLRTWTDDYSNLVQILK